MSIARLQAVAAARAKLDARTQLAWMSAVATGAGALVSKKGAAHFLKRAGELKLTADSGETRAPDPDAQRDDKLQMRAARKAAAAAMRGMGAGTG